MRGKNSSHRKSPAFCECGDTPDYS
jgi:hypothetical protein